MNKNKIYAMIPARIGSTRLKIKNLALIDGKPLIYYAVQAAKKSGVFDKIVINSDHEVFRKIADRYSTDFYLRPAKLGSSKTKSDDMVADFMHAHPQADLVVWVNSIAPLQTGEEVSRIVNYFIDKRLDSLVTVEEKQVHCIFNGHPINYVQEAPFALTQELKPIESFVYSIMMWRSNTFLDQFTQNKFALLCRKFGTYPISKRSAYIIKNDEDLFFAEQLIKNLQAKQTIQYDSIVDSTIYGGENEY